MIISRVQNRPVLIGAIATGLLVAAMTGGCSEQKETKVAPTGPPGGPAERRVNTGADPQKAPPYPGMYGAPAGAR